jgi:hypothetical protein
MWCLPVRTWASGKLMAVKLSAHREQHCDACIHHKELKSVVSYIILRLTMDFNVNVSHTRTLSSMEPAEDCIGRVGFRGAALLVRYIERFAPRGHCVLVSWSKKYTINEDEDLAMLSATSPLRAQNSVRF